jgi:hypothetical protein
MTNNTVSEAVMQALFCSSSDNIWNRSQSRRFDDFFSDIHHPRVDVLPPTGMPAADGEGVVLGVLTLRGWQGSRRRLYPPPASSNTAAQHAIASPRPIASSPSFVFALTPTEVAGSPSSSAN